MRFDIISIDELTNLPVFAWMGSLEFFDFLDHQVHIALRTRGQHKFSTVGADGLLTLLTHTIRHDDDDGITFGCTNTRSGDTCVAGGAFDNAHARAQVA